MLQNHFYLLTLLPSLPPLGEHIDAVDAIAKVREETGESINLLADLLELEDKIKECALQFYVLGNKSYEAALSKRFSKDFSQIFNSYKDKTEADWLEAVTQARFELIAELGRKTGSKLLTKWAVWEYSLRCALKAYRLNLSAEEALSQADFIKDVNLNDFKYLIDIYKAQAEPIEAEKALDKARIEYLHGFSFDYTFSTDELAAYLIELQIHKRYALLNPERGREAFKEVISL